MKIHYGTDSLPSFKNSVITIGSYDGLHYGHSMIMKKVVDTAHSINGESILITFSPHPRHFLNPESDFKLLSVGGEKEKLVEELGLDHLVIVNFNKDFASQTPEEYIEDFLVKLFNPSIIIIGYDHRYGKKRAGGIELLLEKQSMYGYSVEEISKQVISDVAVSSTKIRKALTDGDISKANNYLGYNYSITGKVMSGDQIGRKINFPTANIQIKSPYKLIPNDGVYAVNVLIKEQEYKGMMHIGHRPSLKNNDQRLEVNIFDFDDDIYDQNIKVEFIEKIRSNKKFESLQKLQLQLQKDKLKTLNVFK